MTAGPPAEIAAVLAHYVPLGGLSALRVSAGPQGFSGADVWRVESPMQAFALRQWPQHGLPPLRLRGLHRLLQHLADAGLTFVAAPVRSQTGETLLTRNNRHWQLEPWLPGAADFHANPTEQRLRSAMSALARWHEVVARFQPDAEVREWFGTRPAAPSPAVIERLARLRRLTPGECDRLRTAISRETDAIRRQLCYEMLDAIQSHRDAVTSQLELTSRQRFALQPCLRDIWHDHVLFTGDEVTGLIDPSACRAENVATDLARLLGSLVEDDPVRWQTALDEYRKHHSLTPAEEVLAIALDQSAVLLSAVTWLEWLFVERRSFPNSAQVDQRLKWLHRRLVRRRGEPREPAAVLGKDEIDATVPSPGAARPEAKCGE